MRDQEVVRVFTCGSIQHLMVSSCSPSDSGFLGFMCCLRRVFVWE